MSPWWSRKSAVPVFLFGQPELGFVGYAAAHSPKWPQIHPNPLITYNKLPWYTPRSMDELSLSQYFPPFWGYHRYPGVRWLGHWCTHGGEAQASSRILV